jgi:hypothetical protein
VTQGVRRRAWIPEVLIAGLTALSLPLFVRRLLGAFGEFPWDFSIFWTAARGMTQGLSVYGHEDLRATGVSLIGPQMEATFRTTFNSFIELPTTAFIFYPFARLPFAEARAAFAVVAVVAFLSSVIIASRALPADDRRLGLLLGALFLTSSFAVPASIGVGQVDALVALALAGSVWSLRRFREGSAGAFAALAGLLKVSPGLVILQALMRRKWRLAGAGILTAAGLLLAAMISMRPGEISAFVRDVVPALSVAPAGMENQSLTAWAARILGPPSSLVDLGGSLGPFAALAPVIALVLLAAIVRLTLRRPVTPLEVSLVAIAGLLAGPVTWTHYASFGVVFAVMLGDRGRWRALSRGKRRMGLVFSACGYAFLCLPVYLLPHRLDPARIFSEESVRAHPVLRLASGIHAFAFLAFFVAGLILLSGNVDDEPLERVRRAETDADCDAMKS